MNLALPTCINYVGFCLIFLVLLVDFILEYQKVGYFNCALGQHLNINDFIG